MIFKPGGDEAKVASSRLMQRQQLDANIVDIDVETIDLVIPLDDDFGQLGIAVDERLDGFLNLIFDEARPCRGSRRAAS